MAENFPNHDQTSSPGRDPSVFGPLQSDIDGYRTLLAIADTDPASLGFSPRVNAELTSTRIDRRSLGTFTNPDVESAGLDRQTALRIAQQRYIAAALGLQVEETNVNTSDCVASASVRLPEAGSLPSLPIRQGDGTFSSDGKRTSLVQADAIYAAHFIASNILTFSREGAFERLFGRVVDQAESGQLEVRDLAGDSRGARSMVRQVARVLGYEVDDFRKTGDGIFTMPIRGVKPGFDDKFTHFKR